MTKDKERFGQPLDFWMEDAQIKARMVAELGTLRNDIKNLDNTANKNRSKINISRQKISDLEKELIIVEKRMEKHISKLKDDMNIADNDITALIHKLNLKVAAKIGGIGAGGGMAGAILIELMKFLMEHGL